MAKGKNRGDEVRATMIEYIRENFSELLGEHAELLDKDDGLDQLSDLLRDGKLGHSI